MKLLFSLFTLIACSAPMALAQKTEKLSADEIVSRHIAALGGSEALAGAKSRVVTGPATITSKVGGGFVLNGVGQLASTDKMVVYGLALTNPTYPFEKVAFDGQDVSFGLPSGRPTMLVNYLKAQNSILKDGLLGGSLSAAWPLLDLKANQKVKLETAGTGKVNDRVCYKLKYSSSKTGEMKVTLYFDAENFRHVRTEYMYTIEPRIGTSPTDTVSSSRVERYALIEDFADFKSFDKLTLPSSYKITITTEGQATKGTNTREWQMNVEQVYYDQKLGPEVFKVS